MDDTDIDYGRWLFAQSCRFVAGAATLAAVPPGSLPEVAFAGRSNVGKSSLINALVGSRALARTSQTPGRTRQINFFALGGTLMLVDLPGYGYARAAMDQARAWTRLTEDYLRSRANLRRLCLLIDARRGIGAIDRAAMARLDRDAVSFQVVLTKADKTPRAELDKLVAALAAELATHPAAHTGIVVTSARDGVGIAGLRAELASLAPAGKLR